MGKVEEGTAKDILRKAAFWTAALLTVPAALQFLSGPPVGSRWALFEGLFLLTGWIGLLLPFSAYAGGLAGSRKTGVHRLFLCGALISFSSLALLGYASPTLEFHAAISSGVDVAERFPTGPRTIPSLLSIRAEIEQNPPERFSFRVGELERSPPNWITYRVHSLISISLYAILATLLGFFSGTLTKGLSPPARRNARWAIGLFSGVVFFTAEAMGGDWVRADPSHSGILGAWGPILIPFVELGVIYLLLLRSGERATLSEGHPSNG